MGGPPNYAKRTLEIRADPGGGRKINPSNRGCPMIYLILFGSVLWVPTFISPLDDVGTAKQTIFSSKLCPSFAGGEGARQGVGSVKRKLFPFPCSVPFFREGRRNPVFLGGGGICPEGGESDVLCVAAPGVLTAQKLKNINWGSDH